jgi:hypothetical protein
MESPLSTVFTRHPGPEQYYIKQGVKFFQIFALTYGLGLSTTLCSWQGKLRLSPRLAITAPMIKVGVGKLSYYRIAKDSFIVPDTNVGDEGQEASRHQESVIGGEGLNFQDDTRRRINWRSVFRQVFLDSGRTRMQELESSEGMEYFIATLSDQIKQGKADNNLALRTL